MKSHVVTRFAPSPTGYLHLGHAYAALFAEQLARRANGRFILRIEDIDVGRCKTEFEKAIYEDLEWLGLEWESPVRRQSDHLPKYAEALAQLDQLELIYPCFCTRGEIKAEIERAGGAPHGPEGPVYPGTCKNLSKREQELRITRGDLHALRLDVTKALAHSGPLTWHDQLTGEQPAKIDEFGDVILARKDTPTSYHLSVTVDDAAQGITLVTRGEDLSDSTGIHRLLQALLGYQVPEYRHHMILTDAQGKRFAKRDQSINLRTLRDDGKSPKEIKAMIGIED